MKVKYKLKIIEILWTHFRVSSVYDFKYRKFALVRIFDSKSCSRSRDQETRSICTDSTTTPQPRRPIFWSLEWDKLPPQYTEPLDQREKELMSTLKRKQMKKR